MKIIRSKDFTASQPWGALDIANMSGITTRLHWMDQFCKWHINDGQEVLPSWMTESKCTTAKTAMSSRLYLEPGDIFYASAGTEHVVHTIGQARVLVIETEGAGSFPLSISMDGQSIIRPAAAAPALR